ncbi:hypothetical protein Vretifemale_20587 [Volvox reticuliferus]|uniref:Uncharacterized protein n=1 Tax=Volvox reticuliferus TaxID=1737510 RepID=A0A8J4D3U8_9CHLO|nr:hypothetical protein Vretifemale_20587 [Volvox reticuliferus]
MTSADGAPLQQKTVVTPPHGKLPEPRWHEQPLPHHAAGHFTMEDGTCITGARSIRLQKTAFPDHLPNWAHHFWRLAYCGCSNDGGHYSFCRSLDITLQQTVSLAVPPTPPVTGDGLEKASHLHLSMFGRPFAPAGYQPCVSHVLAMSNLGSPL